MSVQGNTSAIVATVTYVPPFKYVTSYAPAPLITGTVTGGFETLKSEQMATVLLIHDHRSLGYPDCRSLSLCVMELTDQLQADPSTPSGTSAADYATNYLQVHQMR